MSELAQVGVIGMGVMGTNLARNMARHGYRVAIWNLEPERTLQVAEEFGAEGMLVPCTQLSEFVQALEKPRRIFVMVTAGKAVDSVAQNLLEAGVEPGDVIADGGNSFFQDTRRREAELREKGVHFFGVGVSGGEVGALEGPSIMPGGSPEGYAAFGPILETISAHYEGEPCCAYMGADGAGHYVKMVHNGIEYADIEFIAESASLMQAAGLPQQQMVDAFREWNAGELESYLIQIAADVVAQSDAKTGKPLLDAIVDQASQKGTGMWTSQQALELGVPSNTIAEAVFARALSSYTELRQAAQPTLRGPDRTLPIVDKQAFLEQLRRALFCSKLVAYAQGLDQIRVAAQTYGWDNDIATTAKIWRAGCVIRAKILTWISDEYARDDSPSLLTAPSVAAKLTEYQQDWRELVSIATLHGLAVPGFSSALSYYDAARTPRLPAAMVQGLRDYFGAHTYLRVDGGDMPFHTRWSEDRAEVEVPSLQKKAEHASPQQPQIPTL